MSKVSSLTRRSFMGIAAATSAMLAACGGAQGSAEQPAGPVSITGTYDVHVQGFDWGCAVDQVSIALSAPLDGIDPTALMVTETKMATDYTDPAMAQVESSVPRTVSNAALSDDGSVLTLTLACGPIDGSSLEYTANIAPDGTASAYALTVGLAEGAALTSNGSTVEGLVVEGGYGALTTSADAFAFDSFSASDGTTYSYATYDPEDKTSTLVVWLHGLGEGGVDPHLTLLANKVVALSSDEFQQTVGGAHILVPQCPTYWMDADGTGSNYVNGAIQADGTSHYTASLEELIDAHAAKVGADKIVLTGCSNGGYMVMVLLMNRPDAYVGAVPICEAMGDEFISDEQIAALKDVPMYFVYSDDDPLVIPAQYEEPTIARLRAAGATDETLHVSSTEHVVDTTGQWVDQNGDPYMYVGHFAWVYFDNNDCACNECGLKAWEFIGECVN